MAIFVRSLLLAALFSVTMAVVPVSAEPGKVHGKGKHASDHGEGRGKNGHGNKGGKSVQHFNDHDRVIIRTYLAERYAPNCPPGLAKKRNGCLPPGIAKKSYTIGYPLGHDVIYEIVPEQLLMRLDPVPMGYRYVMVDKDVLLISEASHKVIDAITLLSAVGR